MRDFPHATVADTAHRPWPVPAGSWVMTQTWNDLLFAHWPVDRQALRARVPEAFELDLFEGDAWVGVIPFHMTNVALRFVAGLPWISAFPELNVRTYVRVAGKPGVYFFSLDAGNPVAVAAARRVLNLPYFKARMTVRVARDGEVDYESHRRAQAPAEFSARYRGLGDRYTPAPGTLEYFLTEWYCLYATHRGGRAYRLDIHHPPWTLQRGDGTIRLNTMAAAAGVRLSDATPLLHFAKRQDAVCWTPERLG